MSIFSMKDSDGQQSLTLTLVVLPWLALIAVFVWSAWQGKEPNYSDFGGGTALLIATWVGRKAVSVMQTKAGTFTSSTTTTSSGKEPAA